MNTIAVIGPGAIGGTLAAWLAAAATHDVIVCARTGFDRLIVEVPGGRTLDVAPRVLTDPTDAGVVDWVITVTKTYQSIGQATASLPSVGGNDSGSSGARGASWASPAVRHQGETCS